MTHEEFTIILNLAKSSGYINMATYLTFLELSVSVDNDQRENLGYVLSLIIKK